MHISKPKQAGKLAPRAQIGVMVGFALQTKGYRIWSLLSNQVVETKNVTIDEAVNWCMRNDFSINKTIQEVMRSEQRSDDNDTEDEEDGPQPVHKKGE